MNAQRILLIQGHPDGAARHLCHELAEAYAAGAAEGGHALRRLDISTLEFPLLRSVQDWEHGEVPEPLRPAQQDILWCSHLVLVFPLWLGDMPALLKGFLEQVARPGFAFHRGAKNPMQAKALDGRSARVIVTMGMPALIYRYVFHAHSVKSLERNILGFVGIAPVQETLVGSVELLGDAGVAKWKARMRTLGAKAG